MSTAHDTTAMIPASAVEVFPLIAAEVVVLLPAEALAEPLASARVAVEDKVTATTDCDEAIVVVGEEAVAVEYTVTTPEPEMDDEVDFVADVPDLVLDPEEVLARGAAAPKEVRLAIAMEVRVVPVAAAAVVADAAPGRAANPTDAPTK